MTDGEAALGTGAGGTAASLQPRSVYAGHEAFGDGDGAVLVEPRVARNLRLAAESATQEGRIAGGLLYGRWFADSHGAYLVVSGYLEAGPGENRGDKVSRAGHDEFTLTEPDLRLLRRDARRTYTSSVEVGWWRSLPAAGEFGPKDFETQRALVGPGGAGLLVFGSGLEWGTAYLGPEALSPDATRAVPPASRQSRGFPASADGLGPDAALDAEPDLMADLGFAVEPDPDAEPGFDDGFDDGFNDDFDDGFDDHYFNDDAEPDEEPATEPPAPAAPVSTLATRRQPTPTPTPVPSGAREVSPVYKPQREWGVKEHNPSYVGPEIPTDVKIVVGLLCVVVIAAAIMIGMLVSDMLAAVIVGVVGFLVICAFLWFSRL
ncbi:MAG TPA: hypothetical protein VF838_18115 [Trebonia sp.]